MIDCGNYFSEIWKRAFPRHPWLDRIFHMSAKPQKMEQKNISYPQVTTLDPIENDWFKYDRYGNYVAEMTQPGLVPSTSLMVSTDSIAAVKNAGSGIHF